MKKILLIVCLLALVVSGSVLWQLFGSSDTLYINDGRATTAPLDIALDTAEAWLKNTAATSSLPLEAFLKTTPLTSAAQAAVLGRTGDRDPLVCQAVLPEQLGAKVVYVDDAGAQIMILPRQSEGTMGVLALYTLERSGAEWVINDIACSTGEVDIERQFTFDHVGRLAQANVPEGYDATQWHVVYRQDDVVRIAPLLFTAESQCGAAACDPTGLTEGSLVRVQATMLEAGAEVAQITSQ